MQKNYNFILTPRQINGTYTALVQLPPQPYKQNLKKALPWALGASILLTALALMIPTKPIEASVESSIPLNIHQANAAKPEPAAKSYQITKPDTANTTAIIDIKAQPAPQTIKPASKPAVAVAVAATTPVTKEASQPQTPIIKAQATSVRLALPTATSRQASASDNGNAWQQLQVKAGDTFGKLAETNGINSADVAALLAQDDNTKKIARIFPGQRINFKKDSSGKLLALALDINDSQRLSAVRGDDKFKVTIITRQFEKRISRASGVINSSMYGAALKSGMSDNTIMQLADIFGYDIDFSLDIREGDRFNVIWNEYYRDGVKAKDGDILAAEFVNDGRLVRAVRYTDKNGRTDYYTPEGKSLKKAFLRSPVHFTRISSQFNLRRLHPKFNTIRPHRGVDYAAPTGTSIFASGEGKVIFRGQKKGYGNVIILQHPGRRYTTLYAHMSKFNSKAKLGAHVNQGQVIGYVGATGWATGPHLHYEFRKDGVHVNPLTVKLPTANPLNTKQMPSFRSANAYLLDQLNVMNRTQLAQISK